MNKKLNILLATTSLLIIILALAGCVRPASTRPATEAPGATEAEFPVPGGTEDVMAQLEQLATQTAIAMMGGTVAPQPTLELTIQPPQVTPEVTQAEATSPAPATPEPTAQPQIVVPTPTPGLPSTYTLKGGEYPYCIARRFNVNPDEMLRLSGLSAGGTFPPGTVLKIPKSGNTFPGNRALKEHPDTYTVAAGDTIYSIACKYGDVDPFAIAFANNLSAPYTIKAGQELYIP